MYSTVGLLYMYVYTSCVRAFNVAYTYMYYTCAVRCTTVHVQYVYEGLHMYMYIHLYCRPTHTVLIYMY